MTVSLVVEASDAVVVQLKRTTGVTVPATGGLGLAHDVVSVSDTSGPLELLASLTMY